MKNLMLIMGALFTVGCANMPQAGKYRGPNSAIGTSILLVHRDGRVEEKNGPLTGRGTWTPISDSEIKADMQGWMQKHGGTRHYFLERSNWTYRVVAE